MRKSKIYLFISILSLVVLIVICFVFKLPNTLFFNVLRLFLAFLGFISLIIYNFVKDLEFDSSSGSTIDTLRKDYDYLYSIVLVHTRLIYDGLCKDFIEKYLVSIDECDEYLLTLENHLESFKEKSSNNKIDNAFIVIACAMDSLISSWKIKTSVSSKLVVIDDLILLNCKLSVCVALSMMNLSYDTMKDDPYIKRLIELLYLCYYDENYGNISIIENEAMLLELLHNKFAE